MQRSNYNKTFGLCRSIYASSLCNENETPTRLQRILSVDVSTESVVGETIRVI